MDREVRAKDYRLLSKRWYDIIYLYTNFVFPLLQCSAPSIYLWGAFHHSACPHRRKTDYYWYSHTQKCLSTQAMSCMLMMQSRLIVWSISLLPSPPRVIISNGCSKMPPPQASPDFSYMQRLQIMPNDILISSMIRALISINQNAAAHLNFKIRGF